MTMLTWTAVGAAGTPAVRCASAVLPKPAASPVTLPQRLPQPSDTTEAEADSIVNALYARKDDWVQVSTADRAAFLKV